MKVNPLHSDAPKYICFFHSYTRTHAEGEDSGSEEQGVRYFLYNHIPILSPLGFPPSSFFPGKLAGVRDGEALFIKYTVLSLHKCSFCFPSGPRLLKSKSKEKAPCFPLLCSLT